MARLINDLLDASKVTNGKIALRKSRIAISNMVSHSLEIAYPFVEQKQQQLNVESLADEIWIEGDAVRLSQALPNLLVNASKFTPEAGKISLTVVPDQENVRVMVADNGFGIEPDLLSYIFDLFKQGPACWPVRKAEWE